MIAAAGMVRDLACELVTTFHTSSMHKHMCAAARKQQSADLLSGLLVAPVDTLGKSSRSYKWTQGLRCLEMLFAKVLTNTDDGAIMVRAVACSLFGGSVSSFNTWLHG